MVRQDSEITLEKIAGNLSDKLKILFIGFEERILNSVEAALMFTSESLS